MRTTGSNPLLPRCNAVCVATLLAMACAPVIAASNLPWRVDRVTLRGGKVLEGLIEQQTEESLRMLEIRRGRANGLYGVYLPVERSQVTTIVPISEADRQETRQRFDEYRNRVRIEAARMEHLSVVRDGAGWRYRGEDFSLESSAPEEVVRRAIVRVEQIFAAMRQMIPARRVSERPIAIRLFGSQQEYQQFVGKLSLPITNPAVFHRPTNTIALGTDLSDLAEKVRQIQATHDTELAALEKERANLPKKIDEHKKRLEKSPGSVAARQKAAKRIATDLTEDLQQREKNLGRFHRQADALFAAVTSRMFAMLYHEALHAYLENFVYPGDRSEVPRWLHEGIAQIFESSTLDGQTFYVEAPHRASLKRLQASLPSVSLADLLTADGGSFLVAHGENPQASQLNYAAAWGLAHYLTFRRHLVGSLAMDRYVARDNPIDSPIGRFEQLVQMPLEQFEAQWREFIESIKPGG